jgi:hypothetical protein
MSIYEALKLKLRREPTNAEIKFEVKRIISEATLKVKMKKGDL